MQLLNRNHINDFYNKLFSLTKVEVHDIWLERVSIKSGMTILCPAYICNSITNKLSKMDIILNFLIWKRI